MQDYLVPGVRLQHYLAILQNPYCFQEFQWEIDFRPIGADWDSLRRQQNPFTWAELEKISFCSKPFALGLLQTYFKGFWLKLWMISSYIDPYPSPKPSGKLRRLTPSFECILAVRLKKYFFRNKTYLFFKINDLSIG